MTDPLEPRRLLADDGPGIHSLKEGRAILVVGTTGDDVIDISAAGDGRVRISLNGKSSTFDAAKIKLFGVDGDKGNDRITDKGGWSKIDVTNQFLLVGGPGSDQISSASKVGFLDGDSGRDTLTSTGTGRLMLIGGKDDDRLVGGSGSDTLVGGAGADFIDGRGGRDLWTNAVADGIDDLSDIPHEPDSKFYGRMFEEPIKLTLDRKANDGPAGEGDDVRSVEVVAASKGADTLDFSGADAGVTVPEGANYGADSITGSPFNDSFYTATLKLHDNDYGATIHGGAGNDTIRTLQGRDSIFGDAGNDLIQTFGHVNDFVDGGSGNDIIDDRGGKDRLYGGAGNDHIYNRDGSGGATDILRGGSGTDTISDEDHDGPDDRAGFEIDD